MEAQQTHLFMSLVCYVEYKWEITDIICLFCFGYMQHMVRRAQLGPTQAPKAVVGVVSLWTVTTAE